jgi:plasmid maintenance system antidote protein VapI
MTLEQVGDAIGTTKAVIQQLESGRTALSQKWLNKLAPVFGTTPGFWLNLQKAWELELAERQDGARIRAEVTPRAAA